MKKILFSLCLFCSLITFGQNDKITSIIKPAVKTVLSSSSGTVVTPSDVTAPTLDSAIVGTQRDSIYLYFNETLSGSSVPATSAFSVSGIYSTATVSAVSIVGNHVILRTSKDAFYGDVVTFTYTKPVSNAIEDASTNESATITNQATTNRVTFIAKYQPVYNAMGSKPSATDAKNQNLLCYSLDSLGVFVKAELLDVFATHTGGSLYNWKSPGTFNPSLSGTPAYVQYAGYTGSTGNCIRLNFNPTSNGTLVSQDNICAIIGVGTNVAEARNDFGGLDAAGVYLTLYTRATTDRFYTRCNDGNASQYNANTTSIGHFGVSRVGSTAYLTYRNLVTPVSKAIASTGLVNIELYTCGYNNNTTITPDTKQIIYVFIFSGLTTTEVQGTIMITERYLDKYSMGLY